MQLEKRVAKQYLTMSEMADDHYNVGIVGVWYGENYGSVLTYYALQKVIRSLGYTTLMIDKPLKGADEAPRDDDTEFDEETYPRRFARAHHEAISPHLSLEDLRELNAHCDTFIVGSDQLWNYRVAKWFGDFFYLGFVDDEHRKLSYATSFGEGTSNTPLEAISDVSHMLNRFDSVSVRESAAVRGLHEEFALEGSQVLDPVFLLNREDFAAIAAKDVTPHKRYVLAYVLDPSKQIGAAVKSYAKKKGLELVVLLDGRVDDQVVARHRKLFGAPNAIRCSDVDAWLRYFINAEYVVTDSFHGACISLIFEKQFCVLGNERRGLSRVDSLCKLFGLFENTALSPKNLSACLEKGCAIDYSEVNAVLDREKTRSIQWLSDALSRPRVASKNVSVVPRRECCGCGSCDNSCPFGAIKMMPDTEGFLYPSIDETLCTGCEVCKRHCPSLHPFRGNWEKPLVFGGYTSDEVRESSSSGGIFSLLARKVIGRGGTVFGAAFDKDFNLVHCSAQTEQELEPLRKSKYLQGSVRDTFRRAKLLLDAGETVLYVGLPCQVAGLNTFLTRDYDNLLTVDLFCHGAPSQAFFKRYLEEVYPGRKVTYVGFRDKEYYGWSVALTVKFDDGEVLRIPSKKDLYLRSFIPCFSTRPSCQVCEFARLPRQGDLSLADFWGVTSYDKSLSDGNGTSLISVNSGKGLRAFDSIKSLLGACGEVELQYMVNSSQPYAHPMANDSRRARFYRLVEHVPIHKALEACEKDAWDLALVGMRTHSIPAIIGEYVLYQTLSQLGYSVLAVRRPLDLEGGAGSHEDEFVRFAHAHYAQLSPVDTLEGYQELGNVARCMVATSRIPLASADNTDDGKQIPECDIALGMSATLLARKDDLLALCSDAPCGEQPVVGVYVSDVSGATFANVRDFASSRGMLLQDLRETQSVEQFVRCVSDALLIITDDLDCLGIALVLGTHVLSVCDASELSGVLDCDALTPAEGEEIVDACARIMEGELHRLVDEQGVEHARVRLAAIVADCLGRAMEAERRYGVRSLIGFLRDKTDLVMRGIRYAKGQGFANALKKAVRHNY